MFKKLRALFVCIRNKRVVKFLDSLSLSPKGKYFLDYLRKQLNNEKDYIQAYEDAIFKFQNKLGLDRRKTLEVCESICSYIDEKNNIVE